VLTPCALLYYSVCHNYTFRTFKGPINFYNGLVTLVWHIHCVCVCGIANSRSILRLFKCSFLHNHLIITWKRTNCWNKWTRCICQRVRC